MLAQSAWRSLIWLGVNFENGRGIEDAYKISLIVEIKSRLLIILRLELELSLGFADFLAGCFAVWLMSCYSVEYYWLDCFSVAQSEYLIVVRSEYLIVAQSEYLIVVQSDWLEYLMVDSLWSYPLNIGCSLFLLLFLFLYVQHVLLCLCSIEGL